MNATAQMELGSCASHPESPAHAECLRCRRPVCSTCLRRDAIQQPYCEVCGANVITRAHIRIAKLIKTLGLAHWLATVLVLSAGLASCASLAKTQAVHESARNVGAVFWSSVFGAYLAFTGSKLRTLEKPGPALAAVPALALVFAFPIGTLVSASVLYLLFCSKAELVFSRTYQDFLSEVDRRKPDVAPTTNDYFTRHWRGEYSLPISYWCTGVLTAAFLFNSFGTAGMLTLKLLAGRAPATQRAPDWIVLLPFGVACLVAYIWSTVGVWRSASRHLKRGGRRLWAIGARAIVLIPFVHPSYQLTNSMTAAEIREWYQMAIGKDAIAKPELKLSGDGKALLIQGTLGTGAAAEFRRTLSTAHGVRVIGLNSSGGRIREALMIATEVRERALDTYVEGLCASACTLVFLAGRDRAATPNSRIGFHRLSFAGKDAPAESLRAIYTQAGLTQEFFVRVGQTSGQELWFPSRDELFQNNIVTRVSLGGEADFILTNVHSADDLRSAMMRQPIWQAIDKRVPGTMARAAEATWAAKQRGVSDAEALTVGRRVLYEIMPGLLETASDPLLEQFAELTHTQLEAARAVSHDACQSLVAGRLDVLATLPESVVALEQSFMLALLQAAPEAAASGAAWLQAQRATRRFVSALEPGQRAALETPSLANCDDLLAVQTRIADLLPAERRLVLRFIYRFGDSSPARPAVDRTTATPRARAPIGILPMMRPDTRPLQLHRPGLLVADDITSPGTAAASTPVQSREVREDLAPFLK